MSTKKSRPLLKNIFQCWGKGTALYLLCALASCTLSKPLTTSVKTTEPDYAFYRSYSQKFGISFDGTENKQLIQEIDRWLGTPHKLGGCSKKGVDCSCFVQQVYRQVYGIILSRSSSDMYNDVKKVSKEDLQEGDLVFLHGGNKKISHVGIYLKDSKFVHVTAVKGVMISSLLEASYKKSFYAAGRVKKRT